jgi:hypothetical protein
MHGTQAFARGLRKVGVAALAICGYAALDGIAIPAQARCLVQGMMRYDIPDHVCLEAQRTGCVQSLLTPQAYANCLQAVGASRDRGQQCVINGVLRMDIPLQYCGEAQRTGCVRALLTPQQYANCLAAQRR